MADFYADIIADAQALIDAFGRPVSLFNLRDTPPADPARPWDQSPPDKKKVDLNMAVVEYERKLIDNTVIKRTDKKGIFIHTSKIDWEVSTKDYIVEKSGERYIICDVSIIAPGPVKVLYEVQLRKG